MYIREWFAQRNERERSKSQLSRQRTSNKNRIFTVHRLLPLHSLASLAVALAHGRSKKNGLHFSQSRPAVLCLQSHSICPSSFFTQREACPLHLHLPPTVKECLLIDDFISPQTSSLLTTKVRQCIRRCASAQQ